MAYQATAIGKKCGAYDCFKTILLSSDLNFCPEHNYLNEIFKDFDDKFISVNNESRLPQYTQHPDFVKAFILQEVQKARDEGYSLGKLEGYKEGVESERMSQ